MEAVSVRFWAGTVPSPEHLWNPQLVVWKGFPVCDNGNTADVTAFLKSDKITLCVIWHLKLIFSFLVLCVELVVPVVWYLFSYFSS